jgi:hypothetical protein
LPRVWMVLLCVLMLGCGGAAPNIRHTAEPAQRCVYVPRNDGVVGTRRSAGTADRPGVRVVLADVSAGTALVKPLSTSSAPSLEGLSGEGLGDGVPRGVLRFVPEGGVGAEAGAGATAGEVVVAGGAVIAAVGSGLLVCMTASAVASGEKTPVDIADEYYGTHFGDVSGWAQHQYSRQPSPATGPKPTSASSKKHLGRIYVTYTKFNHATHRYYAGRTSMIADLNRSLALQAVTAVLLRDKNHHLDEGSEPESAGFVDAEVDKFDTGSAIDYVRRYDDVAYWRIRGREQQLIDSLGGAQSDTGSPYRTENAVRGVAKDNPLGRRFHDAATGLWGLLHPYTGY